MVYIYWQFIYINHIFLDYKSFVEAVELCNNVHVKFNLLKTIYEYKYDAYCKVFAAVAGIITETNTLQIWFSELNPNYYRMVEEKGQTM